VARCASASPAGLDPCAAAFLPADGPLAAEASAIRDPVALAELRIREARLSGDPGFDTLADLALDCALSRDPADPVARRWKGHVEIQFHRFAEAEARLAPLYGQTGAWRDAMLLGDARMERGDIDGADDAYDDAMAGRPGLELYDRVAHLAWLEGDLPTAIALEQDALSAASTADPEPMAWVATRLGWLRSLDGDVPNELGLALRVMPDYRPAHLALGRYLLATGHADDAEPHLRAAGPTIEAVRALAELDPAASVQSVSAQDRRGYAIWLAPRDPAAAVALLDAELAQRRDAVTRIARAWAAWTGGAGDAVAPEVRAALATGIADPSTLVMAAEVLGDSSLAKRALSMSAGLLPSEQARARAISKID
ncbi:MAG: hypothetical protein ABMB14_28260, partial [Myxococcota bacterium]